MTNTPFSVTSDFSKDIVQKYKRLLREGTLSSTQQPVSDSNPAHGASSPNRYSGSYPSQDLQSVAASEFETRPVGTEKEPEMALYAQNLRSGMLSAAPQITLENFHYDEKRQEKEIVGPKIRFDDIDFYTGVSTIGEPGRAAVTKARPLQETHSDAYSVDTSVTDILKAEHASIVRAIKQRAHDQIMQAHKERDMAINEARESSLTYMQKIDQLESLLMAKDNAIKSLQADMIQLKDLYDTRQQNMMEKQVILEQEVLRYKDEAKSLQTRVEQVKEHERATTQEKIKLATDASLAKIESLENKLRISEKTVAALEKDKLSILQETSKDITEMNRCHEELKTRYSELLITCKKLKQKLLIASSERNALKEEQEAIMGELSGLRERNENLAKELIRADRLVFGKPRNASGVRM